MSRGGGFKKLESHELKRFAGMAQQGDSDSEVELDLRDGGDRYSGSRRWVCGGTSG